MKIEKAQADFERLINKHGFTVAAHTIDSGIPVYHRVWNRENETLEIRILLSGEHPLMTVRKNGAPDPRFIRDYQNPKSAFNAICKIITAAGFEM